MLVGSAADLGAEWVLEEGQKMGDSGGGLKISTDI